MAECDPIEVSRSGDTRSPNLSSVPRITLASAPGRGRGVFAAAPIAAGEVVEVCPVIPLKRSCGIAMPPSFEDYVFHWNSESDDAAFAVAGGFGCFYNHSSTPNVLLEYDFVRNELTFRARRDLAAGEEIRFDYGDIWFAES